ncbi:MAG: hypothetical protein PVF96_04695 [Candidatus Bathyarchaeota archaeon]|jgi:hypothetical protein
MQRVRRKIFWSLFLIFLVNFSNVWVSLGMVSDGPFETQLSVKGTYLLADPDQVSQAASSVDSPGIIDLQSNGFSEGETLLITFEGTLDRYGGSDYKAVEYLVGVFSSTNQLLSIYDVHRVPGAIDAGEDIDTGETWFTHENTDIPEDFKITPSTGFSIKVPQNAKYLFISFLDSYYPDNTAPTPIKVNINTQTVFPLEYLLLGLGAVAAIAALILFFVFKRRKSKTRTD